MSRQTLYRALEALHNRGGRWGLNPSASRSKRTVSWVELRKSKALPQRCSSRQLMLWWGREGGLPAYAWWRFMGGYRLVNLIAVPGREHGQPRTGKRRDDGSQ